MPSCILFQPSDYDGGDCCECTCDYTIPYSCDLFFDPVDCVDPNAPCVNDYVEVGTKTTVGVSANGYDTRPEQDSSNYGCQQDGCAPALTRDGISDDIKSKWSCSQEFVSDGSFCEIKFTFDSPQNVAEVQVAFPYVAESFYWLQVSCVDFAVRECLQSRSSPRRDKRPLFEWVLFTPSLSADTRITAKEAPVC